MTVERRAILRRRSCVSLKVYPPRTTCKVAHEKKHLCEENIFGHRLKRVSEETSVAFFPLLQFHDDFVHAQNSCTVDEND